MKQLFDNQYLLDMAVEAEIQISTSIKFLYVRFPLNITSGNAIYDFSSSVDTPTPLTLSGIIRIQWQGITIWPFLQDQLRRQVTTLGPGANDVPNSKPLYYMTQGYNPNKIKFFPTPNLTIAYNNDNINTKTGIRNNIIVSGWGIADPTGTTQRIPSYIQAPIVNAYTLARAFRKEGRGQNLEAANYYESRYNYLLEQFRKIVEQLFSSRTITIGPNISRTIGGKPPRPILPSNFGGTEGC